MFFNHLWNDFHLWNTHHNVLLMRPQGSNAVDTQVHPLVKTDVSAINVVNSVVFRLIPAILRSHWPCNLGQFFQGQCEIYRQLWTPQGYVLLSQSTKAHRVVNTQTFKSLYLNTGYGLRNQELGPPVFCEGFGVTIPMGHNIVTKSQLSMFKYSYCYESQPMC